MKLGGRCSIALGLTGLVRQPIRLSECNLAIKRREGQKLETILSLKSLDPTPRKTLSKEVAAAVVRQLPFITRNKRVMATQ